MSDQGLLFGGDIGVSTKEEIKVDLAPHSFKEYQRTGNNLRVKLNYFLKKPIANYEDKASFSREYFDYDGIWDLGFPYYVLGNDSLYTFSALEDKPYQSLFESLEKRIVSNDKLYSKLANSFFPHMFDVQVEGMKHTPKEAFFKPEILQTVLYYVYKWYGPDPDFQDIRAGIRLAAKTQCVTNFKPSSAKCLYDFYGQGMKIFDYSLGFGGRLVGALASQCSDYIGVDVNSVNFPLYEKVIKNYAFDLKELDTPGGILKSSYCFKSGSMHNIEKRIMLFDCGSEDFRFDVFKNYFDISFSSPPYFTKEHYSNDPRQCFNRFPGIEGWKEGYWRQTIRNQFFMLKPGGRMIVNISDVRVGGKIIPLREITEKLLEEEGFVRDDYFFYPHEKAPVQQKAQNFINQKLIDQRESNFKLEPIINYRKPL